MPTTPARRKKRVTPPLQRLLIALFIPGLPHAAHAQTTQGPAPTASIESKQLIRNNSTTGRKVLVTLEAKNVKDEDCVDGNAVQDEIAQYEWVIPAEIVMTTNSSLNGDSASFTTADDAPLSGTVELLLKDRGNHAQDNAELKKAAELEIELVDPTDFRVVEVKTTSALEFIRRTGDAPNDDTDAEVAFIIVGSTTSFQLEYDGEDLPWAGQLQKAYSGANSGVNQESSTSLSPQGSTEPILVPVSVRPDNKGLYSISDFCQFRSRPDFPPSKHHGETSNGFLIDIFDDYFYKPERSTTGLALESGRVNLHVYRRHFLIIDGAETTEFGTPKIGRHWFGLNHQGRRSYD